MRQEKREYSPSRVRKGIKERMVGKRKKTRNAKAPTVVCGMRFKCQWITLCKFSRRTTGILVPHTLRSMKKDIRHMLCTIIKPVARSDEATRQNQTRKASRSWQEILETSLDSGTRLSVSLRATISLLQSMWENDGFRVTLTVRGQISQRRKEKSLQSTLVIFSCFLSCSSFT